MKLNIKKKSEKPFIFCSFHPTEFKGFEEYVHYIKLKKDVRLFFMIDIIKKNHLISSIEEIAKNNKKKFNLLKMGDDIKLKKIAKSLKKEKFNGWFTPIEGGTTVEVALLNRTSLFKYSKTKYYKNNTKPAIKKKKKVKPKKWGKIFKICSIKRPIKLNINIRFKRMIEMYKKYERNTKYLRDNIFQILLDNAKIKYHNNKGKKININNYNKYNNKLANYA